MLYKGNNVEFIQLVSYMGEAHKKKALIENQNFFMEMISGRLSFPCSFECPAEDIIYITHKNISSTGDEIGDTKALLKGLKELKKIFPYSFINLCIDEDVDKEGTSIDLTEDEFIKLYCQFTHK
jgi:hypothetical protein